MWSQLTHLYLQESWIAFQKFSLYPCWSVESLSPSVTQFNKGFYLNLLLTTHQQNLQIHCTLPLLLVFTFLSISWVTQLSREDLICRDWSSCICLSSTAGFSITVPSWLTSPVANTLTIDELHRQTLRERESQLSNLGSQIENFVVY